MKTYNFKLLRTYQTKFQLTAESEADARRKFDELSELEIRTIEHGQCDIISSVFEVDVQLTKEEKAQLWFESKGMKTSVNHLGGMSIVVESDGITYYFEVSDEEIYSRARMYDKQLNEK